MKKNRLVVGAIPVLIVLLGLILYQYGYVPIQEKVAEIKEEQQSKTKTLEKSLAVIAEGPDLKKKLADLMDQRKTETEKLISGDTFSLAAANLQEMVKGIISSRGGVISSERVGKEEDFAPMPVGQTKEEMNEGKGDKRLKPKKEKSEGKSKYKVVNVGFDFTASDTAALRDIVFFIETKTPFLVIRELDCRVRNFQQPRELMVKLEVSALFGGK